MGRHLQTALDVKSTINVTSAESAGVQIAAAPDHLNNSRTSQVLFKKGVAILAEAENQVLKTESVRHLLPI
jgi:hypothetical protein